MEDSNSFWFFCGRRGPWGQLAMRHRRREARARSFDRTQLLSFLRFAGVWRETVFGPDSQQASRSPPRQPSCWRRRSIGAAILQYNSPFFAPAFTGQGRGDDRGNLTARVTASDFSKSVRFSRAFFPGRRSRKAATWLILPVVICLSQRLSHACLSINCFIL